MGGHEVEIDWRGRPVWAWIPDPLVGSKFEPSAPTARRSERAAAALLRVTDHLPPDWEPLARLLLRTEGVASSYVEGVRAPIVEVAAAELTERAAPSAAAWVADNVEVTGTAMADARRGPLTVADLLRWHGRLMVHRDLPAEMKGAFRTTPGWVGGSSPLDAAYVPPPADRLGPLVDDLVAFANRFDVDPVDQAALVHAQFETIHPFGDGNGRIGRVLIAWVLVRRTDIAVPPPVSVFVARDRRGYLSGLHLFRTGGVDQWVSWFVTVVERSARATLTLVDDISALLDVWTGRLADLRVDATARQLVTVLPGIPVLSAPLVGQRLGVSPPAARGAIVDLAERDILQSLEIKPLGPGRPPTWYMAQDVLELVRRWSG
jgi:Fic family protein